MESGSSSDCDYDDVIDSDPSITSLLMPEADLDLPEIDERLKHVFDGEYFRMLRAPRTNKKKKKKKKSIVIPVQKLILLCLRTMLPASHPDSPPTTETDDSQSPADKDSGNDSSTDESQKQEDGSPPPDTDPALHASLRSDMKAMARSLCVLQDRLMSTLTMTETVNIEDIRTELDALTEKTPVTLLMELAQCLRSKVNFVEVGRVEGPSHAPKFTVVAVLSGRPFTRIKAGNKRECKNGAAYLAWKTLIQEQQDYLTQELQSPSLSRPVHLALLANLQYLKLVEKNPLTFTGRRVLAAVIMQRKQKKPKKDNYKVVSLAIGNRCIQTAGLSLDGTAVNDSHAEVLARRGFIRFLMTQLTKASSRSSHADCVLERSSHGAGRYKVKSSVSFHLYVSDAPCGDASLFTKSEEVTQEDLDSTEPLFTSKQQGLLRTKIEAVEKMWTRRDGKNVYWFKIREGAIPSEAGGHQNLVSLQFGSRLRTMTCSDKLLKWSVCGLQGALLSHVLDPVYLGSVSIGSNYVFGHLSRALNHRLSGGDHKPAPLPLPPGYRTVSVTVGDGRHDNPWSDTEKSSAVAVVWTLGDGRGEVTDGTTGRLMYTSGGDRSSPDANDNTPSPLPYSCVCKRALFSAFLPLASKLGACRDLSDAHTYREYKAAAGDYQTAKAALTNRLGELGYGGWVYKPEELEYFNLQT